MLRRPPMSTRTYTPMPYPTCVRSASAAVGEQHLAVGELRERDVDRGRGALEPALLAVGAVLLDARSHVQALVVGEAPVEVDLAVAVAVDRSEEHTSELQSLMRISYAVFCLKKKNTSTNKNTS